MRLSIEVSPEQHQRLKAMAALRGQSIKDYVLERVFPKTVGIEDNEALRQLEAFLAPRIEVAKNQIVDKSVEQIFAEVHEDLQSR